MKWKLRVKWNLRRKKLQESVTGWGDKYFIFRGSHENYLRNGALILEESIALFHGRANPLRHFSVGELNTMNVETVPVHEFFFHHKLYKGSWEGRDVFVGVVHYTHRDKFFLSEIVVGTQMATHTNVHKLLGCCLETVIPVLVYEWVAPQTLENCILRERCIIVEDEIQTVVIEWKDRLRIAWEISHIIAYLHTAFPRPILYLNMDPNYVFLSPERDIKLSDFSLCASIPKNQEFAKLVVAGRVGFIAPEYLATGKARESADVYSFGVLLLMLLTRKNPSTYNRQPDMELYPQDMKGMCAKAREMCIYKKIDPTITRNGVTDIEELQLRYSIQIALLCIDLEESCRPTMVEVATMLMNIIKSPQNFVTSSISKMFQLEHYNNHTGDDEFYDCDDDSSDNNDEWKLRVKRNQIRKKLQKSETRCDDKYLIFEGSHENYLRNRAQVLEESIALFQGRANPFRHFSVGELNTMNVETVPVHEFFYNHKLYKGSWEGRDVFVGMVHYTHRDKFVLSEIVVGTQMATHTNVHKLLGCCLETVKPVLVYEWVAPQTLQDCILLRDEIQNQRVVVEWKDRLRIAWEISHIIAYLHTAFPRPILYLNWNPSYMFLSPERDIKISDFSLCASIPMNQEFAEVHISGRIDFIAPEYAMRGEARESTDVYSFGILLLMLLTGIHPSAYGPQKDMEVLFPLDMKGMCAKAREMCIYKKIDPTITRNGVTDIEELQLRYSIHIALLCVAVPEDCRPTMVEVSTELMNIIKSPQKFVTSRIFKVSVSDEHIYDATKMFMVDFYNNHTSDDESYDCDDDSSNNNDEEYYDCEQNKDQCNDDAQG